MALTNQYEKEREEQREVQEYRFKDLFADFIAGQKIARRTWNGYWVYKYGKIEIHTKTGEVVGFLDTADVLFTVSNILQNDWIKVYK